MKVSNLSVHATNIMHNNINIEYRNHVYYNIYYTSHSL